MAHKHGRTENEAQEHKQTAAFCVPGANANATSGCLKANANAAVYVNATNDDKYGDTKPMSNQESATCSTPRTVNLSPLPSSCSSVSSPLHADGTPHSEPKAMEKYLERHERQIQASCRKYTNDRAAFLDFCQECRLTLCLIWRKNEEEAFVRDLDSYTRHSIWICVQELFRSGHNPNMAERDRRAGRKAVELNEEIDERHISKKDVRHGDPEQLHSLIRSERLLSVLSSISPAAQAVLHQLMEPGSIAFETAREEYAEAVERRKAGALVMNLTRFMIRKKHIARQLGVSPATISRAIAEIESAIPVE